jgi:hypothetical protein
MVHILSHKKIQIKTEWESILPQSEWQSRTQTATNAGEDDGKGTLNTIGGNVN